MTAASWSPPRSWPLSREHRRPDLAPQNPARRALRERLPEPDVARVLVDRDPRLDERLDVRRRRLAVGLEHDRRAGLLAELVVGEAGECRLDDVGVLVDHLLDLARVDVEPAADDHLLLAVGDEEVALVVDAREVAG